jgi:hypothetical protein
LDEQMWRAVLARFDGSAMTVQEFCLREGLTRSSFTRWRSRLRAGSNRLATPTLTKAAAPAPKPSFVDLGLVGAAALPAERGAVDLHIELGGGLSLHLVRR